MTKEHIKQDIAHLLETIAEQVETIYTHEHKIPQIELDIILSNVRNLYEQVLALNKMNSNLEGLQAAVVAKEIVNNKTSVSDPAPMSIQEVITEKIGGEEKLIQPSGVKKVIAPEKLESIEEKIEIIAGNKAEKMEVEMPPVVKPAEQSKPIVKEEPKVNLQEEVIIKAAEKEEKHSGKRPLKSTASLFDAAPSLGGQFDDAPTLKEKINSSKNEKSVADKIHHQKIEDLKKAIGINEKFLFINELFEGSLASYNEHIEKINTSIEINHARSIMDSLIAKYNWDTEQDIVKKFMDLVERRFL